MSALATTLTKSEIEAKLQELREKWKTASEEDRRYIEAWAKGYKNALRLMKQQGG